MQKIKTILLIICLSATFSLSTLKTFAGDVWINDLRTKFLSNQSIIYGINIRTFNAKDKNKDGIIDESAQEERGNFLNAIDRLDELKILGINTVNLLPVTPVGKIKALGTAGSLYAASGFNELNPQLKASGSKLSIEDEMRKFIQECHKRDIYVIVDLPCCGSYDLYLKNPNLFIKNKEQNPIIPSDWTDVRLLDAGSESQINGDVYNLYAGFIDLMLDLNVDGVKVNVPSIKPAAFWKKLIDETRTRSPQFLFLAETSLYQAAIPSCDAFTSFNKLMDAGFDGYYGNYSDLKNWKKASDLISHVKSQLEISKKYSQSKSVIGDFATHDQVSPVLVNGVQFSKMIIWLNATLPLNSYAIDGFPTGDDYIYFWANKKAPQTFSDDDYYFVHRGQLDIFNFSRKPFGKHYDILQEFVVSNKFRKLVAEILSKGDFLPLKTNVPCVFAYSRNYDRDSIIVIGNLDFKNTQQVLVNAPRINKVSSSVPIKILSIPTVSNGKIDTSLTPGEIQVIYFHSLEKK